MSEKMVRVGGLEFCAEGDDEPRALDIAIGKVVGLSRPRDVRRAIRTALRSGLLQEKDCRALGARRKIGAVSGEVTEFWLTEMGARLLATQLNSPLALAMTREMVEWFVEARRQLREPVALALPPSSAEEWAAKLPVLAFVRDSPIWVSELRQRIGYVAFRQGLSWRACEGWLRRSFGVVSYLRLQVVSLDQARRLLDIAGAGDVTIGRRVHALPPDTRQTRLFGAN